MRKGYFFKVQNEIFDHKLPPTAFFVYCYLCKCANQTGSCYPSKRTIANACGIAVSSVSNAIKLLDELGLSRKQETYRGGRQINNTYTITDLSAIQTLAV